jgi:WD40 repeat protein
LEDHTDPIPVVELSYDGQIFATASMDKTVRIWDLTSGEQLRVLEGHDGLVEDVKLSYDN